MYSERSETLKYCNGKIAHPFNQPIHVHMLHKNVSCEVNIS